MGFIHEQGLAVTEDWPRAVLLDTCALLFWLVERDLAAGVEERLVYAGLADGIYVSTASAWEIGRLGRPQGSRGGLQFIPDAKSWFARVMSLPAVKEAALTPAIAIDATYLPGEVHDDPADRLIIATARAMGLPIVTRAAEIIAYAAGGYVEVIAC